jgi:hypothetical protein
MAAGSLAAESLGRRHKGAGRALVWGKFGGSAKRRTVREGSNPDRAGATQPHSFGPSAQLGERRDGIAEAASSNLERSTNPGLVAQVSRALTQD